MCAIQKQVFFFSNVILLNIFFSSYSSGTSLSSRIYDLHSCSHFAISKCSIKSIVCNKHSKVFGNTSHRGVRSTLNLCNLRNEQSVLGLGVLERGEDGVCFLLDCFSAHQAQCCGENTSCSSCDQLLIEIQYPVLNVMTEQIRGYQKLTGQGEGSVLSAFSITVLLNRMIVKPAAVLTNAEYFKDKRGQKTMLY